MTKWILDLCCRFNSSKTEHKSQEVEDVDVAKERQRVLSGGADGDVMKLENLTKVC